MTQTETAAGIYREVTRAALLGLVVNLLLGAAGHQIGHDVKRALIAHFAPLRDVLVHLEPHAGDA